jgi:hypothetical protein
MSFDPYYKWLGIPPKDQPPNHYRLLGIELFEADPDVIDSAAHQRMLHLRGFQAGQHSADSQRLLNEIAAARICLLAPEKRAAYDAWLREHLAISTRPEIGVSDPSLGLILVPSSFSSLPGPISVAAEPVLSRAGFRRGKKNLLAGLLAVGLMLILILGAIALWGVGWRIWGGAERGWRGALWKLAVLSMPGPADDAIGPPKQGSQGEP